MTPDFVMEQNKKLSADVLTAFNECHQVLRDPGKELLVFIHNASS